MNQRYQKQRHRSGFTLAELLVSISIIVLFVAFLLPGFSGFGRRNELSQGAQLVQSKILEAKSNALGPRATGGTSITEYAFVAPASTALAPGCNGPSQYAIVEITQVSPNPAVRQVIACELLPNGLTFVGNVEEVRFSVVGQGTVVPPTPQTTSFQISHPRLTAGQNTRTITIRRATGQVTIASP